MLDADQIAPGLWQGSFPEGGTLASLGFQTLVLAAEELQLPVDYFPGVEVLYAPNNDDGSPLTREQLRIAIATARQVEARIKKGQKVLVTCAAGVNRSGLISALTLHFLYKWSGEHCVSQVRKQRRHPHSRQALSNPFFVQALQRLPGI